MLACVSLTRGDSEKEIWFAAEPMAADLDLSEKEFLIAFKQVAEAFANIGLLLTLPSDN
jgi:SSS family solute:Na+ symporter